MPKRVFIHRNGDPSLENPPCAMRVEEHMSMQEFYTNAQAILDAGSSRSVSASVYSKCYLKGGATVTDTSVMKVGPHAHHGMRRVSVPHACLVS